MGISTIFEKGKPAFDGVQVKPNEFVRHDVRVRDLATVDAKQLTGVNLEAELRFPFLLGDSAENADPPIATDVVVPRAEVGT
jgi:hypothetical protein